MTRKYTGFDANAKGRRAGTEKFTQLVCFLSGNKVWNNGTWAVRNARGKDSASVHGTGRAIDFSWRKDLQRNRGSNYAEAVKIMDLLVQHADLLRIEMVSDYQVGFGRTWKCDRNAWKVYDKPTIHGAPGGDWFHVELSPEFCDDPAYYDNAFKQIFSGSAPAPAATPVVEAPKPAAKPAAPKPAEPAPALNFAYPGKPLKLRSKGDEVRLLQAALKVAESGKFDKETNDAVVAFQNSKGLKADGVVGPITWKAIFG